MSSHIIIKSMDERTFTGYISVELIDNQNDIVPVTCLDKAMGPYLERGGQLQLVHSNIPVGRLFRHFLTIDPETEKPAVAVFGKIFSGGKIFDKVWQEFLDPDTPVGFSIAGNPVRFHSVVIDGKMARSLDEIELYEISVVCNIDGKESQPANDSAKLIGLGYIAQTPIPIVVKMVLSMGKEDEEKKKEELQAEKEDDKEEDKDKDKEEDKDKDDVEKVESPSNDIFSQIEKEAQDMMGGNAAVELLKEHKQKNIELSKTLNTVLRENEDLKKTVERIQIDITELEKAKIIAETKADAWREMFRKNTNSKDALTKMLEEGKVVINQGVVPPNQGKQITEIVAKATQEDTELVSKFITTDMSNMSDEDFLKIQRSARKL